MRRFILTCSNARVGVNTKSRIQTDQESLGSSHTKNYTITDLHLHLNTHAKYFLPSHAMHTVFSVFLLTPVLILVSCTFCYSFPRRSPRCLRKALNHWIPGNTVSCQLGSCCLWTSCPIFFLLTNFLHCNSFSFFSFFLIVPVVPRPGRHRRPMTAPKTQKDKASKRRRVLLTVLTVVVLLGILVTAGYFSESLCFDCKFPPTVSYARTTRYLVSCFNTRQTCYSKRWHIHGRNLPRNLPL